MSDTLLFQHEQRLAAIQGEVSFSDTLQQSIDTFAQLKHHFNRLPEGDEKQRFLTRLKKADREITTQVQRELQSRKASPTHVTAEPRPEPAAPSTGKEAAQRPPSAGEAPDPYTGHSEMTSGKAAKKLSEVLEGNEDTKKTTEALSAKGGQESAETVDGKEQPSASAQATATTNDTTSVNNSSLAALPLVAPPAPANATTPPQDESHSHPRGNSPQLPGGRTPSPPSQPVRVPRHQPRKVVPVAERLEKYYHAGKRSLSREELRAMGYNHAFYRVIILGKFTLTRSLFGQTYSVTLGQ